MVISHGVLASIRIILKSSIDVMRRVEPQGVVKDMSRRIRSPSTSDERTVVVGGKTLTNEREEWE
ncbi:unnamed protein product [Fusarium graminearum]|uniref:Uncharacterized protein n=1 Tax=Gibberella zeae TaxID=5518 RepID=A0A4E9EFU4_GIBZA|nr:unnamed protein product [Fusarium graminearum]CAG1979976.1 unnamed protein product [Fusarium graminearum]